MRPRPSFVALVVRSTGRRPWRDRLTELAAVRVLQGRLEASFSTELSYTAPRPRRQREGDEVDDAVRRPTFAEIEMPLRDFLGSLPLLGPDIRLHLEHLSFELSRLDRPGLDNPALDLASLAELALSSPVPTTKPSLGRLAERLGLPPPRPGQLGGEARLAARVALRLLDVLEPARFPTLEAVLAAVVVAWRRPLVDMATPRSLPAGPGVYLLRDEAGQALYVGKAADLRGRLSAYLGHQLAALRRMDGLADSTAHLELHPADSELEASLLEARLIRQLAPRYNVQRRIRPPRLFLRVHPWETRPRLTLRAKVLSDGATYLGPFRTTAAAERARRLANAVFELGLPARATADEEYRQRLQEARLFLTGQREHGITRLRARLRKASAARDGAALVQLQSLLRQCLTFSLEDAALSMSPQTDTFLACDGREAYLIHAARLVARVIAPSLELARAALLPTLTSLEPADPSRELDESAHLVLRWLGARGPDWQVQRLSLDGLEV